MYEQHENEQYFFDQRTVEMCADLLEPLAKPCVLCAPLVGVELERRGGHVITLDSDERFAKLRGFRRWGLFRPERLTERFGIVFCDPPFFNTSLSQLFRAVRMLTQFDFAQRLAITYLRRRRADAALGKFAPFGLRATEFSLAYQTVRACEKNDLGLFANFAIEVRT